MMGSPRQTQVTVSRLVVLQSVIRGNGGTTTLRMLNRLQPLPAPPTRAFRSSVCPFSRRSHCFQNETSAANDSMCSPQLGKSKLFRKRFLEDGIEWGPPEEEAVSVSCAAAPGACAERLSALLCCSLPRAAFLSHGTLWLHPRKTELTLK